MFCQQSHSAQPIARAVVLYQPPQVEGTAQIARHDDEVALQRLHRVLDCVSGSHNGFPSINHGMYRNIEPRFPPLFFPLRPRCGKLRSHVLFDPRRVIHTDDYQHLCDPCSDKVVDCPADQRPVPDPDQRLWCLVRQRLELVASSRGQHNRRHIHQFHSVPLIFVQQLHRQHVIGGVRCCPAR
ncbi:uncharacterized protein BcabD6B2_43740 [Babesia caballi]|uniref:Uncharacterized protein n=1 Tax=Babesia caballi TaxID=5871 RepID=A0AAV4LYV3_BABCB|nr:hypothetical protein, conserved [Babesia caballi]